MCCELVDVYVYRFWKLRDLHLKWNFPKYPQITSKEKIGLVLLKIIRIVLDYSQIQVVVLEYMHICVNKNKFWSNIYFNCKGSSIWICV